MQASLLIVDSIATNRVALKVKLQSAWYDVSVAACGEDALKQVAELRPHLILVNNTLSDMHVVELSARLKATLGREAPPLLALSDSDAAREPLLRSGVEDVLLVPVDEQLLLARIRSVLRAHASEAEWRLRDCTTRALGFAEPAQLFLRPVSAIFLHAERGNPSLLDELHEERGLSVRSISIDAAMRNLTPAVATSVVILSLPQDHPDGALRVLSDLRANPLTRHTAILVAVPADRVDLAAQALDLGADDAVMGRLPVSEMSLRVRRLHARREIRESLRATVKNGAEAAIRDPLTGLYNRRYALPHLERVAEQSRLSGRPFAVMIADLDHFKRVNDWYGHEAGDSVLIACAQRLQKNIRAVDFVARLGGEEFLLVLPNTSRAEARRAAYRLCQRISEKGIKVPGLDEPVTVTVSIGLALSGDDPGILSPQKTSPREAPNLLIGRADKALYKAKEMGRNRFMLEKSAA